MTGGGCASAIAKSYCAVRLSLGVRSACEDANLLVYGWGAQTCYISTMSRDGLGRGYSSGAPDERQTPR